MIADDNRFKRKTRLEPALRADIARGRILWVAKLSYSSSGKRDSSPRCARTLLAAGFYGSLLQVSFSNKKKQSFLTAFICLRAENETRTRDPNLGKVMLYQLSYFRDCECKSSTNF